MGDVRRQKPPIPDVYNNLAVAYWKMNRPDDATQAFYRVEALGFAVNPRFRADLERAMSQTSPR